MFACIPGAVGLCDDHRKGMGHDVMHFSSNMAAFIGGRKITFLLAFNFQPAGPVLEGLRCDSACPGQVAEGPSDRDSKGQARKANEA